MGLVFLCEDEYAGMPVALKTFQFQNCQNWKTLRADFRKEADIWIQLGRQYHVVRAYEVFNVETNDGLWPLLVTEFVEGDPRFGPSLVGWIEHNALDLRLILLLADEICTGMIEMQMAIEASGRGTALTHGDIKPENVLISSEGVAKITDFGIAKILGQQRVLNIPIMRQTMAKSFCHTSAGWGTPVYMSPERCAGRPLTPLSDIYSFGCVLYELCSGYSIFDVESPEDFIRSHISSPIIPPEVRNPRIPANLSAIIKGCLDKDPTKRPQSFRVVRDLINSLITERNYPRIWFFLFGFSAFSDKPRLRKDLNVTQEGEVFLLDATHGADYVIRQGFAANVEEVASILSKYRSTTENEREERCRLHNVDDYLVTGDSFLKLSESADCDSREESLRSALGQYRMADKLSPNEPRILFRLGMAWNTLAETIKQEKPLLGFDLFEQAKDSFTRILQSEFAPFVDAIGNTLYFLPYHALFHRAVSYLYEGDLSEGTRQFESLIAWTTGVLESTTKESDRFCLHEIREHTKKLIDVVGSEADD